MKFKSNNHIGHLIKKLIFTLAQNFTYAIQTLHFITYYFHF